MELFVAVDKIDVDDFKADEGESRCKGRKQEGKGAKKLEGEWEVLPYKGAAAGMADLAGCDEREGGRARNALVRFGGLLISNERKIGSQKNRLHRSMKLCLPIFLPTCALLFRRLVVLAAFPPCRAPPGRGCPSSWLAWASF